MSTHSLPVSPGIHPYRPPAYRPDGVGTLRRVSSATALPLAERDALEPLSRRVALDQKQTLYGQDEPAASVYNVTSGALRLYRILTDGRRQVTGFAFPGDFLGLSMLDRFSVSADALGPVTACRFERLAFMDLLRGQPGLMMHLHAITGQELSRAKDMMMLLGRRTAEERIATFLTGLQARYVRIGRSAVTLELPMGRLDIADHLGLTIETVSRTLSRLDRDGAILIVPGGVRLIDQGRLDRLSAQ
ncbi:helix-turn-helix domain-containing protein [Methylobacterium sp. J-026]|uniref:cyclic nucleotide-binding domain-containing protein n=1 Tax=Methylobacterium sp. J-026 TaxID=2836624 RepID=UPI001FBAD2ED|nr:cyclic nucleotide-binding domain-containing protein [Methylobacterium sp. J-026]MCJ2136935.1 helix-turn-helix domain-containing protein [Methylobacterium sp. J-026]